MHFNGSIRRLAAIVATSMMAALSCPARAADTPPAVEDFFRRPLLSGPELSPSGKLLAVAVAGKSGRTQLAVIDVAELGKSRIVAAFQDADVRRYHWVNDKRLVLDTIDYTSAGGGDFGPGLFAVDADGTSLRRLIRMRGGEAFSTGTAIASRELTWNHQLVSTIEDGSADVIVKRFNFHLSDVESTTLFRLNTETGILSAIDTKAPPGAQWWLVDADGQPRAVMSMVEGRAKVYWRGPKASAWELLAESANGYANLPIQPYAVDRAGNLFVLAGMKNEAQTTGLFRYNFADRQLEAKPLVAIDGFDFSGSLVFDDARQRLMGVHYENDAHGTVWLDAGMRRWQEQVDKLLALQRGEATARRIGVGPAGAVLFTLRYRARHAARHRQLAPVDHGEVDGRAQLRPFCGARRPEHPGLPDHAAPGQGAVARHRPGSRRPLGPRRPMGVGGASPVPRLPRLPRHRTRVSRQRRLRPAP